MFDSNKRIINQIANIILQINSNHKFFHTLVTTIIEGNLLQYFYLKPLPTLVDIKKSKNLTSYYTNLVLKTFK